MYILLYLLLYLKTIIPSPYASSFELKRTLKPFAQGFPNYILMGQQASKDSISPSG